MEPNNANQDPSKDPKVSEKGISDIDSLAAEGIDIVGSGVAEDNEFNKGETDPAESQTSIQEEAPRERSSESAELEKELESPASPLENPPKTVASEPPAPTPAAVGIKRAASPEAFASRAFSVASTPFEHSAPEKTSLPIPDTPAAGIKDPVAAVKSFSAADAVSKSADGGFAPKPASESPQKEYPVDPLGEKAGSQPVDGSKPIGASNVQNDPSIKPIRTFKSDAEEAVRYQNVSAIDIAVAEQKKKEKVAPTPIQYEEGKKSSAGTFVVIALVLVLALAGGWYYWFYTTSGEASPATRNGTTEPAPKAESSLNIKTLIPYAKGSLIRLEEGSDPLELISAKLSASNAGLGKIYALVPVIGATTTEIAPIQTVLEGAKMPARLSRSLGTEYMTGAYTFDKQGAFLILTDTFFQNAFSGMLEWEKDMKEGLFPLIRVTHPDEISTPALNSTFEDTVVSNIDTRILKNTKGDILLLYAFADKDTIVIATNIDTLKYALDRLLTVRTIQ